jgi:hypothetical protein
MFGVSYTLESFPSGVPFVKGEGFNEGSYVCKNKAYDGFQFARKVFPSKCLAVFDNSGLLLWSRKV